MIYDSFRADLLKGILHGGDPFYCMLVDGYSPDPKHSRRSDVNAHEITASGYDSGGKAVSLTPVGARIAIEDVRWTGSLAARGAVIYKSHGGPPSYDELVGYLDFGKLVSSTDSTFTVHFQDGIPLASS